MSGRATQPGSGDAGSVRRGSAQNGERGEDYERRNGERHNGACKAHLALISVVLLPGRVHHGPSAKSLPGNPPSMLAAVGGGLLDDLVLVIAARNDGHQLGITEFLDVPVFRGDGDGLRRLAPSPIKNCESLPPFLWGCGAEIFRRYRTAGKGRRELPRLPTWDNCPEMSRSCPPVTATRFQVPSRSACLSARMFLSVSNIVSRSSGQCSRRYRFSTMISARNLTGSGFVPAHSTSSRRT